MTASSWLPRNCCKPSPSGFAFHQMYHRQKLLVINRGEIAVRIIRTAKRLGLPTVAVYTSSDALSPHVDLADESVPLSSLSEDSSTSESESKAYLDGDLIISICRQKGVTMVHPGYGFLSENAEFAEAVVEAGLIWIGPRLGIIRTMGMKHEARKKAIQGGLAVVPGSDGLVETEEAAVKVAIEVGFPVMVKATSGGGGMGMVVVRDELGLREAFSSTKERAKVLFGDDRIFVEKYFDAARHIEVQIFGDGEGLVVHMGERECSMQRRHQKVIEETPSPFFLSRPELRGLMCEAAVSLGKLLNYNSAGTVEFIVDDHTGHFYFLEMNTRIQVEHPITEAVHPGLDLVHMMIDQAIAENSFDAPSSSVIEHWSDAHKEFEMDTNRHAIEVRVYAEDPSENFRPCPGLLQFVDFGGKLDWLRVETWVSTGTTVTPYFDPLLFKIIVTGASRQEAISRLAKALEDCTVCGPPNNIEFLKGVVASDKFKRGDTTTTALEHFKFIPRAMKVLAPGIDTTVQDLPGRLVGPGIPRSGPMDFIAFQIANLLVSNPASMEGVETVVIPGVSFSANFTTETVVAVCGKSARVTVNEQEVDLWRRIVVPAAGKLEIRGKPATENVPGLRVYLAIRGGFPAIPQYLSSKSTSMGLGGYQGRALVAGDQIALGSCAVQEGEETDVIIPQSLIPQYPSDCVIHVLAGPHDDEEFITAEGIEKFYSSRWRVSASSNRMGIRLEGQKIEWARPNGGEGGSHPSNILDNAYATGSVNINGDTPVILGSEGPDMGGYVCLCTVASGDMWKLGQLSAGNTIQFKRISWADSHLLTQHNAKWISSVESIVLSAPYDGSLSWSCDISPASDEGCKLRVIPATERSDKLAVTFRQAGDSAILVEFGAMELDFKVRALIHAFEQTVKQAVILGVLRLSPCIRSTMCSYDPQLISQTHLLDSLCKAVALLPESVGEMQFPAREIRIPIVLDDPWSQNAIERYMRTTRDKAVYLPNNVDYLARNNGLQDRAEALEKLMSSDWMVFGIGFYLACPFLVPIDPRSRLVGQKMNPSRTYTPRGAVGIAGPVAAIYPVESPGGYQLFGRALPAWNTWGKGTNFSPEQPWLLEAFDKVHFYAISESEYMKIQRDFDAGRYVFEVQNSVFSMAEYDAFVSTMSQDVKNFRKRQAEAVAQQESEEHKFLEEWESVRQSNAATTNDSLPETGTASISSPVFASVWKIKCRPGDIIQSADHDVVILEAMKTEIGVKPEPHCIGKRVVAYGKGISEGVSVQPGDTLVIME